MALLVLALERFDSPWAIGLILLADVIPGMVLGPVFGAVADRWSRRTCVIVADLIRVAAFAGLVVADDFTLTVGFALLAGIGTALFQPASLAALPSLVAPARLPAATSVYGALMDVGFVAGPALAAGFMLAGGPEAVLVANAVTFAVSALLLASIQFGEVHARDETDAARPSLIRDVRDGLAAAGRIPGLRVLLLASASALFFGGLFNVAELLLATEELGTSAEGFSLLVAIYGLGFVGGSVAGARGGSMRLLRRRYLGGLLLAALGTGASGLAPSAPVAALCFIGAGYGAGSAPGPREAADPEPRRGRAPRTDLWNARWTDGMGLGAGLRHGSRPTQLARNPSDCRAGGLRSLRGVAAGRAGPEACGRRCPAST